MSNPEMIVSLADRVSTVTAKKIAEINQVTGTVKMLALNALIEASRAGSSGLGFAVVANEVKSISTAISRVASELEQELAGSARDLSTLGRGLVEEIRGARLADLALNMIEIIDRNLYERSCDVRWWATDAAVVDCAADPTPENRAFATKRLAVILSSYTVYMDLWIVDRQGKVIATGRPAAYPRALGHDVSGQPWFRDALSTRDGTEFTVANVTQNDILGKAAATYSAAIRAEGEVGGEPIGVLGIFFDWEPQAQTVVTGVRLHDGEKGHTRCLLLDREKRVIAASDNKGILTERFPLETNGRAIGHYTLADGSVVGFAETPGYETYEGLGWYGVIVQSPAKYKS